MSDGARQAAAGRRNMDPRCFLATCRQLELHTSALLICSSTLPPDEAARNCPSLTAERLLPLLKL